MHALAQKLDRAVRHHQAGELQQAERLYSQILRVDPKNVDALHLIGLVAGQFGRRDLEITCILEALRLKPDFADAHNNLGNAFRSENKLDQAVASYRQAINFKPSLDAARTNLANALLTRGNLHHAQGKLDDAVADYRDAIRARPDLAEAYNNLGNALRDQGKLDDAVASYQDALRLRPDLAETHSNLGFAYRGLENVAAAIASCREALRLKPDLAEAHVNLANALHDQGKLDEAVAGYQRALGFKPDLAEAHNNLGNARWKQARTADAEGSFREAVRLKPDYAEALANLGNALCVRGMADQALTCFRKALSLNPDLPDTHNNLGNALQDQGKVEEAVASYRKALSLRPAFADAHNNLGAALLDQGRIEEALACIQETLRVAPDYPMAWHQLGRLVRDGKFRVSEAQVEQVRQFLTRPEVSPKNKTLLHFALAYMHERHRDYDLAFEHYREGNACRRQSSELCRDFDVQALRRGFDEVISTFNRPLFERMAPWGNPSDVPVFIVGMPRSGTTLVEQILSSHPRFAGSGELLDIGAIPSELPKLLKTVQQYPACMAHLTRGTIQELAARYLERRKAQADKAARVSDKMPQNYAHLGLIAVLFPNVRVIHCRRDPRDTCVSCFCENFEKVAFTSSLDDLGHYYREYARLMAHWRQMLPLAMFEVQYEDLVSRQEALSREMVAFCGLDWDDRCLQFHQTQRPVFTASNLQVRQPIYASSVGRWRRFEAHLGSLLELLKPCLVEMSA